MWTDDLTLDHVYRTRLLPRVEFEANSGCWLWTGALAQGYGRIRIGGRKGWSVPTHQVAYVCEVGPIPDGLQIDHLCRTKCCANPAHMEPVTMRENVRRSPFHQSKRTHCPKGHPYDDTNTYVRTGPKKQRGCRACRTAQVYEYRATPVGAERRRVAVAKFTADPANREAKRAYMVAYNAKHAEKRRLYMLGYNRKKRAAAI